MPTTRFLADEMLGRLARYLRFAGCDTVYVRGLTDDAVLERARSDGRTLLTRDRALARRSSRAVLLTSPFVADQWRAVRAAFPDLDGTVRFDRCTECNGVLAVLPVAPDAPRPEGVPWDRIDRGLPLYRCTACGHLYWEGTHTESVRRRLASWSPER